MRKLLRGLSLAFTAGAFGAFIYSLFAYFLDAWGVHAVFGVKLKYSLTPDALYPALIWGGLFGLLLLVPLMKRSYCIYRGLALGLVLSILHLAIIYPYMTNKGFLGLKLGLMAPLAVIFYNGLWGIFAAFWLDYTRERV